MSGRIAGLSQPLLEGNDRSRHGRGVRPRGSGGGGGWPLGKKAWGISASETSRRGMPTLMVPRWYPAHPEFWMPAAGTDHLDDGLGIFWGKNTSAHKVSSKKCATFFTCCVSAERTPRAGNRKIRGFWALLA